MDFKQIDIKLLDINPSGIVIIRTDGSISYANKKAAETLGLSASLISERSYNSPEWKITDFEGNPFPDEDLPFSQVMRNNAPVSNIKHAVEWPDGKRVYLSINANPIISKQGVTDGVFVTIDDISSRVNTGKKLELTDSGSGFDPSEAPKKSLGMELINTLFANLDAELEIRSENEFFVKSTFREKISGAFGHPV